jgi:septal ring factor EnvC (AmiA/AmiB activator)
MARRLPFALAAALFLLASPAIADEPSAADQLKDTEEKLNQAQNRNDSVSRQAKQLAGELNEVQKDLVKLADTVQRNEKALGDDEDKLRILAREEVARQEALAKRRKELTAMVRAAISLSQTPPQAALMMPGDFDESLRAARVLSTLTDSIKREAESIGQQVQELGALREKVQANQQEMAAAQQQLKTKRQQLDVRLKERRQLAAKLGGEQEGLRRQITELSRQAEDLKDLIGALERNRKEETERKAEAEKKKEPAAKTAWPAPSRKLRSFAKAKGDVRMPVAGRVKYRFGQLLRQNETSKGVTVAARAGAQVVAPFDAEVVFVGPFLNYGRMVILRHSDDYHTLLAGFGTVSVNAGEFLLEGEPIGAMGDDASSTELYVELREHNQPVDPAPWVSALQSR